MALLLQIFSFACLAAGAFAVTAGGLGVLRMPDVYSRLHAAGVTDTLGAGLVLFGLCLYSPLGINTLKLLLILGFLWLTSPVFSHVLVKVAFGSGVCPWRQNVRTHSTQSKPK